MRRHSLVNVTFMGKRYTACQQCYDHYSTEDKASNGLEGPYCGDDQEEWLVESFVVLVNQARTPQRARLIYP